MTNQTAGVYEQAKARRDELQGALNIASAALKSFPRLPNGLTPDAVKATPEFQSAKSQSAVAFNNLRVFNQQFVRLFKRQIRLEKNQVTREANQRLFAATRRTYELKTIVMSPKK